MNRLDNLSRIYKYSEQILFDDSSKFVFMSDVHRGDGSWADDFSKNQNLYFAALTQYYKGNYTYIENGDGDELWKFNELSDIIHVHSDVFWILSEFYKDGRLYFIYGNHDMVKKKNKYVRVNMYQYYNHRDKKYISLFEDIVVHEGLVMIHKDTGDKIFIVHGHQVDFMSNTLWKFTRFLVKYLWRPLEIYGANDPTSTAKNYTKKERVEKKLTKWVSKEDCIIITGHTHRPMLPEVGEHLYFNDGSCVHPRCITAIEIAEGDVILVKWVIKTKIDGTLYIAREVLAGPIKLKDYFNS